MMMVEDEEEDFEYLEVSRPHQVDERKADDLQKTQQQAQQQSQQRAQQQAQQWDNYTIIIDNKMDKMTERFVSIIDRMEQMTVRLNHIADKIDTTSQVENDEHNKMMTRLEHVE